MKNTKPVPEPIPRLNSLLHRLQQTPAPKDEEPYLDQLMIFLDEPPPDVRNRWEEGAAKCAAWGIATTDTSVWRLYRTYMVEWRARLALQVDDVASLPPEVLRQKAAHLNELRTCEMLASPNTPPLVLLGLSRIQLRERVLELARQKLETNQQDQTERAIAGLEKKVEGNSMAKFALGQLKGELTGHFPPIHPLPPILRDLVRK
jgi:hypothetical protein